ncbi:hypothetical protein JTE90_002414 [Oedothorax gibbosus]|uniref:Uncharacterized protein n=1 Tax=Oedothorax gibbosus TaxID=931172 RepID=A0AAV6UVN8_9ARAC|nr:hypothetical protein JTE90_002414 [Oedothorax gibbosus]
MVNTKIFLLVTVTALVAFVALSEAAHSPEPLVARLRRQIIDSSTAQPGTDVTTTAPTGGNQGIVATIISYVWPFLMYLPFLQPFILAYRGFTFIYGFFSG